MAKKEDVLEKEAKKIGYGKMLSDIDGMLREEVTSTQKTILQDQQSNILQRLEAL